MQTQTQTQVSASSKVMAVTPDLARHWLSTCNYKNNRPINKETVSVYAEAIKNGEFLDGTQITFGLLGEAAVLLDGQHRLSAIVKSNIPLLMTFTLCHAESETELSAMYSKFDRQRKRNSGDTYKAFGIDGQTGLSAKQITKADHAIRVILAEFKFSGRRNFGYTQDRLIMEKIIYYKDVIKTYYDLMNGSGDKMRNAMERSTTFSIALVTIDGRPGQDTVDFWARLADGDMLQKTDPRFWLRESMLTTRNNGGINVNDSMTLLSSPSLCKMVAMGWNMYIQGKCLKRRVNIIPEQVELMPFGIIIK